MEQQYFHFFTETSLQLLTRTIDQPQLFEYLLNYSFFLSPDKDDESYQQLMTLADSVWLDHLEGGFFNLLQQELTDLPIVSKSLTFNAQYINLFTAASGHYFEGFFSIPVIESAQWVIKTLQSPTGAFYLGVTSNNGSKCYYSMTIETMEEYLDKDHLAVFVSAFNLVKLPGLTISVPARQRSYQQIADDTNLHIKQVPLLLESARQQIAAYRNNNHLPTLNKLIVCKDNGKIISALFKAARQFNREDFATAACLALKDLKLRLWDGSGLRETDTANTAATADDYLLLINALLNRLQHQWCDEDYKWLLQLAGLLAVQSGLTDQVIASRHTGSIITDFYNLYLLSANETFKNLADTISLNILDGLKTTPEKCPDLLLALLQQEKSHHVIVIRGSKYESAYWQQQLATGFKPNQHIFAVANIHTGPDSEKFSTGKSTQAVACQINKPQKTYTSLHELLKDFP